MVENENVNKWMSDESIDPNEFSEKDQDPIIDDSSQNIQQPAKMLTDQPEQNDQKLDHGTSINPGAGDHLRAIEMDTPKSSDTLQRQDLPITPNLTSESEQTWFRQDDLKDLLSRWKSIQSQFVDEPCSAVEQGEALVAELAERVKQMISDQQQSISQQWLNHDDISTEDLRTTLLNYRTLLNRMLKL